MKNLKGCLKNVISKNLCLSVKILTKNKLNKTTFVKLFIFLKIQIEKHKQIIATKLPAAKY